MSNKHAAEVPVALEAVVARLGELETVFGTHVRPHLDAVRDALLAAMAARERGDPHGVIDHIGTAMERLTTLADQLDPAEAMLMRALAQTFRSALLRGNDDQAKQSAAAMFQKSGAVERKKP